MKALSLWQPWASAIAVGLKTIETRGWQTPYRGRLAIHAAKTQKDPDTREPLMGWWLDNVRTQPDYLNAFLEIGGVSNWCELPFGAIVATCDLVDCVPSETLLADVRATRVEQHWGNFGPKRFGWLLANVQILSKPIAAIGKQGLFEWRENE